MAGSPYINNNYKKKASAAAAVPELEERGVLLLPMPLCPDLRRC